MLAAIITSADASICAASLLEKDKLKDSVAELDREPIFSALSDDELQNILSSDKEEDYEITEAVEMPPKELRGVLEAIFLVSTKPMSIDRMKVCLPSIDIDYLEGFLLGLSSKFKYEGRGWDLKQIGQSWQLLTSDAYHPWIRKLFRKELPSRLSKSAMETLAIVAYKQPITRGGIEDVRGVACGPMLRQLLDLRLLAVVGRDDETLGRPMLYGTTETFLDRFGLSSVADLPKRHEFGG